MSKLNEYAIMYVDDEALSLKYFEKQFSGDFDIHVASNATDGWEIIQREQEKIGVVMSDQRMPGQSGVQLLENVRHQYPQIIRILVTAYSDIESAVAGINASGIYKYISKPWDVADLKFTLLRALEFYGVLKERDHLLREKLSVVQQIVLADRAKNLGVLAAGLNAHFRYALRAASAFVAAIPFASPSVVAGEPLRRESPKNVERELQRAAEDMHYIASGAKALADDCAFASAVALPLEALLEARSSSGASGSPLPLALKIDPALPPIQAHPKQIAKLIDCLTSNSLAVSPSGTALSLAAERSAGPNGEAMIRVHLGDEGPDWTAEQRSRFFAPFASYKPERERLGLDLAICYFIAHHHGGGISVPGRSKSRVVIDLPVDPVHGAADELDASRLADLFRQDLGFL